MEISRVRVKKGLLGLVLATFAGSAAADPVSIIASIGAALGGTMGAVMIMYAGAIATGLAMVGTLAMSAYGTSSAKRKQRAAAARARAEYNASLQDRMANVLSGDAPFQVVYGTTRVGCALVGMFTSNKTPLVVAGSYVGFGSRGDEKSVDALRHMVVVFASHQCEDIQEIFLDGVSVGPLNEQGYALSAPFATHYLEVIKTDAWLDGNARYWIPAGLDVVRFLAGTDHSWFPSGEQSYWDREDIQAVWHSGYFQFDPKYAGKYIGVNYEVLRFTSAVRVSKHLGVPNDPADPYLMAAVPSKWTADHKLSGFTYAVITLDLNNQKFQNGPPAITANIVGKAVFDPRTGLTAYSSNPALCTADFLNSPMWSANSRVSVIEQDLIAAANTCDERISLPYGNGTPYIAPRYTCNGSFTSDDSPEGVLEDLVTSMAGYAFVSGGWRILAGTWSAPEAHLTDEEALAPLEIVQVGASRADIFNGGRGNYIQANTAVSTDFPPYSNAVLVEADGAELWSDFSFPFTNEGNRCRNLVRINVERSRAGLVVKYFASMKYWGLQPGARVLLTSAEYGFQAKTFRVTEWAFGITTPVVLTLQEDSASVYDQADQVVIDQTPNTELPDPFVIPEVSNLEAFSGTADLLLRSDGSIVPRVRVTWDNPTNGIVAGEGYIEIEAQALPIVMPARIHTVRQVASNLSALVDSFSEGEDLLMRARFVTSLARGPWTNFTHRVLGKLAPPSNVGAAVVEYSQQALTLRWPKISDLDVAGYEVRTNDTDWGKGGEVFKGNSLSTPVQPHPGSWYIRAYDTTNNYSLVSSVATYAAADIPQVTAVKSLFADTSLTAATVTLSWDDAAPEFGLGSYRISYDDVVVTVRANTVTLPADWIGVRTFEIATIDRYGGESVPLNHDVLKLAPMPATNLRAQVIDNSVLLYWKLPEKTSLPLSHTLIKKGTTWETAETVGTKAGDFTSLAELAAGTNTYWLAVVDTDGHASTPVYITTSVSQPPDFVLNAIYTWDRTGTLSNAYLTDDGVLLPVDTEETWAEHFVNNGWASPQAQIDAGFPVYAQKGVTDGFYEQTFDYGTALASSNVRVEIAGSDVAGAPEVVVTTSLSLNGETWTDYPGMFYVYALNFRFVKVRVDVTQSAPGDLYELNRIDVRIDSKLKTDSGTVVAQSTDALGTVVNFNSDFVDVASVSPAPLGTEPRSAVVDMLDAILTGTYTVASNVVTVTTPGHNLVVGQKVRLAPAAGTLSIGVHHVASVIDADNYTVAAIAEDCVPSPLTTYPNSMRVYLYDAAGDRQSGPVSWTIRGS